MSTLDLKNFGVQELNTKEMAELEGGVIPVLALFVITDLACIAFGIGAYNGYKNAGN